MSHEASAAAQLRTRLRALLRTKHLLLIEPAERPADSQLRSHLGGDPYFKPGETWPTNPDTGQPLELIFQLVNDDGRLPWPFEAQVVQFYHNYHWGELPFDDGYEPRDFRLKTYPRLRPEQIACRSKEEIDNWPVIHGRLAPIVFNKSVSVGKAASRGLSVSVMHLSVGDG